MSESYTRNLRLRVAPDLTADARYNLNRIDLLGGIISTDTTETTSFRSAGDIVIEPESPRRGGDGTTGVVFIRGRELAIEGDLSLPDQDTDYKVIVRYDSDSQATANRVATIKLGDSDRIIELLGDLSLSASLTLTGGHAVQLTTTGPTSLVLPTSGTLATLADIVGSSGDVNSFAANWLPLDGTTKNISHGLTSTDVLVSVIDESSKLIGVDVTVTDANNIQLTSSEAPTGSWRVIVHA